MYAIRSYYAAAQAVIARPSHLGAVVGVDHRRRKLLQLFLPTLQELLAVHHLVALDAAAQVGAGGDAFMVV